MEKQEKHKKHSSIIWLAIVALIAVGLLLFCQFYFGNATSEEGRFFENTHINGVNVSGMTKQEAENILSAKMVEAKQDIDITLHSGNKQWKITGEDLQFVSNLAPTLTNAMEYGKDGNIFSQKQIQSRVKKEGLFIQVPCEDLYSGIDQKVDAIAEEIEFSSPSSIVFNPEKSTMFSINGQQNAKIVDRDALKQQISLALMQEPHINIEVPVEEVAPKDNLQEFLKSISLRSRFETDLSKSTADRKANVALALSKFNGMIVEPQQTISFNQTTGSRTAENGYKPAKIIVSGKYVSGMGGGVCQASTTLYNALLLSDVDILQVFHHTLPASYVPLSFDAMVSEGYADLVFKNNLPTPIFIKAFTTDSSAVVEIYGQPFDDGMTIKTRAELVKIIPHGGDDIVADKAGEYEDKVLYKGEYYRLKYPIEGYESKGFIQYFKDGQLVEEKQVRHDKYLPQNGIIIEGTYSLEEGMTIPSNCVKYIPPQKVMQNNIDNAKARFKMN